ncbi:hypothetical protein I4F81_012011 [Pyropia yezoensis]|uniref:Uncharacterized protein n=1 Tax=Pyropia yezoensis TaxID=2788 RepID=A0ACC3CH11_PYRYE|nr:hypothetical protein I4F81_012011 [Neopyropia yezoensis]
MDRGGGKARGGRPRQTSSSDADRAFGGRTRAATGAPSVRIRRGCGSRPPSAAGGQRRRAGRCAALGRQTRPTTPLWRRAFKRGRPPRGSRRGQRHKGSLPGGAP